MGDGGRWRALLEGEDAERARAAADAVTADLAHIELDPSLYYGHAGLALLHGYRARTGQDGAIDAAADALAAAAASFAEERAPWLARGFAGVAFAIAHLGDLVETDEDTLPDLDAAIGNVVDRDPWPFDWELMVGLIGLGVYGLERAAASAAGRAIVERAAGHLGALAERTAAGATWRAKGGEVPAELQAASPDGLHSLGFAYGNAGAVAFLAAARAIGIGVDSPLLADGVAWLRAHDRPGERHRFPAMVGAAWDGEATMSRGWCNGDLGVGTALVQAGLAASEPAWVDHGVAVAAHGARTGWTEGDLSLCHGAVGHGHLLNRLAQATGSSELADLARAAYRRALAARVPGTGIGGFTRIARGPKSSDPQFAPSLQLGATGVAIGLLAAAAPVPPDWDRAFLMTLPPRP
ncbi:MAG TPA: lanthionine synthetase LanC family protein [Kofleriaceae bacterium]|nr:lanthionine synthetase LanC family protein [Kofleriaceae bacterium]